MFPSEAGEGRDGHGAFGIAGMMMGDRRARN